MTRDRFKIEIKEISAQGSFEGILSHYGNIDQGGDVVEPGAFAKNLDEQGLERPMLWQHKSDVPIGLLTLDDRKDGLWCKGQLLMDLPEAQKAHLLIKAGIVKGLSIGYEAVKKSTKDGVRMLKELKLFEGSIVTFPMNEMALITTVKRAERKDDFNEELSDIQLSDAGYQMRCALGCALSSMIWSGMSKDQIVAGTETVIQQFSDAYMAYLPAFLDMLIEDGYLSSGTPMEMMSAKQRFEAKVGRMISQENMSKLDSARGYMKNAHDIVSALLDDSAGSDTTSKEAGAETTGEPEAAKTTEPDSLHSMLEDFRTKVRDLAA